jgi:hypothetical protein
VVVLAGALAAPALGPDGEESRPHYCWLACGPQKKVNALVRVEGEEVAIDRDGDGKFGETERFKSEGDCKGVVISDPDGRTSYEITYLHVMHVVPPEKFLTVRVRVRGALDYHQNIVVQMAAERKDAPQAHVHGPLAVSPAGWTIAKGAGGKELVPESLLPPALKRAGVPSDLHVYVTTAGKGSVVGVCSPWLPEEGTGKSAFPEGVHPFADVEFPGKKPGDPPVKRRYALDKPVGDGGFRGAVDVPEGVGAGKTRVTFSFEAWKGAKVAPTTAEIPVGALREDKK